MCPKLRPQHGHEFTVLPHLTVTNSQMNKVKHREMMFCGAVCVVFYRGGQRKDCVTLALLYAVLYKPIKTLKLTRWRELKQSPTMAAVVELCSFFYTCNLALIFRAQLTLETPRSQRSYTFLHYTSCSDICCFIGRLAFVYHINFQQKRVNKIILKV